MEEQKVSRPRVTFFQPRVNQVLVLFSLFNGSEVAVKRFLPKSHLSTVIIRDNTSVQRIQEIKVNHLEETRIKTSHFYEHLKKKFTSDQQKKFISILLKLWTPELDTGFQLWLHQCQIQRGLLQASSTAQEPQPEEDDLEELDPSNLDI
ncbi:uncharacterized protein C5orf52 homolog [Chrysemys picta bellii]|uniref:uncharacterized protein C5orf52 homolog n=1 Tax=Chrysemys picta bellii TaxID=8478 RepID=UPI0032B1EA91